MTLEVELQAFDGPLDLLLGLIEKNKINIFDIPIVEITDQYLAYVEKLGEEDLDVMSEFMVMAAELIAIKCRMLLPKEDPADEEEGDPREELVRRLLEYKTYKYMSYELKDRMEEYSGRYFRGDRTPDEVKKFRPKPDLSALVGDVTLAKLQEVFDAVLRRQSDKIDPMRSRFGTIEREEVSLPDKLTRVVRYARRRGRFSFRDLLERQSSKMQIVVTFLAVLTLIGSGMIRAEQSTSGGDIELEAAPDADLTSFDEELLAAEFGEGASGEEDG